MTKTYRGAAHAELNSDATMAVRQNLGIAIDRSASLGLPNVLGFCSGRFLASSNVYQTTLLTNLQRE
jgi:hypothetical protein